MYVKRIELNGFKSFAEATRLDFQAPYEGAYSVTAIVGPNGSGKSNIADAVRWVLGEQSMKQLRGKKSHDIIFGGSAGKGKMSAASVTITLDNSDHRAPLDYEELVVTRRAYQSGDNEYEVNGNIVRLLDLQLLLAQAQFGHGAYSVIGQGMIDQLLIQTPAERKDFFDEAVGIKEFQLKRHHGILKLEKTAENITQAELVLHEVEPRLRLLKRQVGKLEQRQEVEIQLRELQEAYYFTLHSDLASQIEALQKQFATEESTYQKEDRNAVSIQEELSALAREGSRQEFFASLQSGYQAKLHERNEYEKDRAVTAGRLQTEFARVGKHNVGWLQNKMTSLTSQRDELDQELKAEKEHLAEYHAKIGEIKTNRDAIQQEKIELYNKKTDCEKNIAEVKQGNHEFLIDGYKSIEAIVRERHRFSGTIYGMVAELAEVESKFRVALEVAAQSHLASLVVEDDTVAEACIAFLKRQQLGTATFLPLNTIRPRIIPGDIAEFKRERGVYGLAIDLVKFKSLFANVFSYVFGSTLVIDTIDTARKIGIGRVRMVTLEGDIIEASGSLKGGYRKFMHRGLHFSMEGNPLISEKIEAFEQGLEKAIEELHALEAKESRTQKLLVDTETDARVLEGKIQLLETRQHELIRELSGIEQEHALSSLGPEDYNNMMGELAGEQKKIETRIAKATKELKTIEDQMALFHKEEEEKRQRVFALQDALQSQQARVAEIATRKNGIQMELVKLETREEDVEQELFDQLKVGVGMLKDKGIKALSHDTTDGSKVEIEKLKYKLSLIGGIDDEVVAEYQETKEKHEHLTSELTDLQKAYADLEDLIQELDTVMEKKHSQGFTKIKKEFRRYFELLFDGGEAELKETYGEEVDEDVLGVESVVNVLDVEDGEARKEKRKGKKILQGVDVFACPPGKKVRAIQALSGGERTLTAIALVCAILHVNPPPFVLFDEVEAALDEANTLRFTKILHELSRQSQFIVITHNRVTMHAANILYGVTIGENGVSKLVGVTLGEAKKQTS